MNDTIKILIQVDAGNGVKELDNVYAKVSRVEQKTQSMGKTWGQTFIGMENRIRFIGGSFQSLGNTLTRLSRPMHRLFSGTVLAAGYKFFNMMTEGISGAASRYDIMATYEKQLTALGYGKQITKEFTVGTMEAGTALQNLENSVLGLPTSLDDMVASMKKYLGVSGNVKTATKAAIAANNLFLAQGTNAKDQLRAERVLRTMLSSGNVTKQRWQTVVETMPLAIREVGKAMGYTEKEFRQLVVDGKVDAKEFLNTFLEVANSGAIRDAVEVMKHTFGSVTANITIAFKRMGEGVIKAFDEIFMNAYGKDTIDMLFGVKVGIDKVSAGIQDFIKSNPKLFTDFIDTITSLDWKGLFEGIGEGVKLLIGYWTEIIKVLSGVGLKNVGKWYMTLGLWGKAFTLVGGLIKGIRMPLAGVLTIIRKVGGGALAKKGGLFQAIISIFTGNKVAQTASKLGRAPKITTTFQRIFASLEGMLTAAGAIGITVGTVYGTFKGVKAAIRELGELIDVAKTIDWDEGIVAMGLIGTFLAVAIPALRGIGAAFGKEGLIATAIGGLVTVLASGTIALDMELLESAVKSFSGIFDHLDQAVGKLNKLTNISITTSKIKNLVNGLNSIYEQLSNLAIRQATNPYGDSMLSVFDVVTLMENTIGTLHKVVGYVNEMPESTDFYSKLSKGTWIVKNLASWVGELNVALRGDSTDMANVFNGLKEFEEDFKPFADLFNSVQDIAKKVSNISAKGVADGLVHAESIILLLSNMRQRLSTTFTNRGTTIDDAFNWAEGFATDLENMLGVFTNLTGIIDNALQIQSSQVVTKKLEKAEKILTDLAVFGTNIRKAYNEMGYAVTTPRFPSIFGISLPAPSDMVGMFSNAKDFASDLGHMVDVFQRIGEIVDEISAFPSAGEGSAFQEKLGSIIESVKSLGGAFKEGLIEGIDFAGIGEIFTNGVDELIKTLDSKGKEFQNKGKEHAEKYKNELKKILRQIQVTCTINVTLKMGQIYGLPAIVRSINEQIKRAIGGSVITTSPNIDVSGSSGSGSGSSVLGRARGGIVPRYYAKGGSIFKPRGTDTVPAMLTPGEYVHRRSAVRTFGKDFMDRINNLDVEGAMKSLYSRFGSQISNSTRSVVNNYNTVNNNQKVTQNVNTNNPNFAFKRSSRYMGAV